MRKLLTISLAVLFAALSTSAMAGGRYYGYDRYDRYDRGHHRDAYLAGGLLLGLVAGAALSDRHDDRYRRGYYDRYDYGYGSRNDYGYDSRNDYGYDSRYDYGYYSPPRYGREVVVRPGPRYYAPRRYYGGGYYAPPRRVIYRDHGYRRW